MKKARFIQRKQCINCSSTNLKTLSSGKFNHDPLKGFIEADPWGEDPLPYLEDAEWKLVECEDCHQKFHQNILAEEFNDIRFNKWMNQEAIDQFISKKTTPNTIFNKSVEYIQHILQIEEMTKKLRGRDAIKLLDFGCGHGQFLAICKQFGINGFGVDRAIDRIKYGQVTILPSLDDLHESNFHVITLFEVLEHLDNPAPILKALHKRLVRGGLLILETPDCEGINDITDQVSYRKIHPLDHINAFTHASLCNIAKQFGFMPIKTSKSYVTTHLRKVVKTSVKQAITPFLKQTTRQYFYKT